MQAQEAQLVVNLEGSGWCSLNQENLDKVIAPVRNEKVVVLSVAGAFRKGKSFLLNLFLKYFGDPGNWMASNDSGLHGFPWRSGAERETSGIHLWSEPILCRLGDGTQVAVLLLDTQGIFDNDTTRMGNVKIFVLSTLLSSIQIYNLSEQIQSSDMANLEFFAQCARHSSRGTVKFQKLVFLIRNFDFEDYAYGADGGMRYLENIWQKYSQMAELNSMKENIKSCFEKIECFLMPVPSSSMSRKSEHNFKMSDLSGNFKDYMKTFVEGVLSPQNLIQKDIGGVMTAGKWAQFFSKIVSTLNDNCEMLSPPPLFELIAETMINGVTKTAIENYMSVIKAEIEAVKNVEQYRRIHDDARSNAVSYFEIELVGFEEDLVKPKKEEMLHVIDEAHERNLSFIQISMKHIEEKNRNEKMQNELHEQKLLLKEEIERRIQQGEEHKELVRQWENLQNQEKRLDSQIQDQNRQLTEMVNELREQRRITEEGIHQREAQSKECDELRRQLDELRTREVMLQRNRGGGSSCRLL